MLWKTILAHVLVRINFIRIFRLRIAEILEYFKKNARLKFHQDSGFMCI